MKRFKNGETVPSCSALSKKKKVADSVLVSMPCSLSPINFKSSKSILKSILSPISVKRFFNEFWEKQPLYVPVSSKIEPNKNNQDAEDFKGYYQKLFNIEVCKEIMKNNEIFYGVDLMLCKYASGKRINLDKVGPIKFDQLQNYFFKNKMTLQFHQPQRFHDELWKIQELFECYFGSLVGSNIYMTPEDSQGLAPHYDNVEVFILQLEGSKIWKLYEPIDILPKECSADLTDEDLSQTKLIQEVTLNVGDLLYFPRGTIHQAKVLKGSGHSTHVTISTYASNSFQDYVQSLIPHIAGNGKDAAALRRGVPFRYHEVSVRDQFKDKLSDACQALTNAIKKFAESEVCDECACDFFANRLPPFGVTTEPLGQMPNLDSVVRMVFPKHVILSKKKGLYENDENEDMENDSDSEEDCCDEDDSYIYLYHSLKNDRSSHMLGNPKTKPHGLKFDASCWDSLKKLHQSSEFISAKELNLPEMLGIDMLVSLWSEGLIETKT